MLQASDLPFLISGFMVFQITAMDISAGGGLGISASIDGSLHLWDTNTGSVRVRMPRQRIVIEIKSDIRYAVVLCDFRYIRCLFVASLLRKLPLR